MTVITIDGPAGSGKSTVAKKLALKLNFLYLETGAIYRAVALIVKERFASQEEEKILKVINDNLNDLFFKLENDKNRVFIGEREITDLIKSPEVSNIASSISKITSVRKALIPFQRSFKKKFSIVAEGRDTGTVIFPDADLKIYLTADISVRAQRRYVELVQLGYDVNFDDIKSEMLRRDLQDMSREIAPLRKADDAILIDTSDKSVDEVVDEIIRILMERNIWKA